MKTLKTKIAGVAVVSVFGSATLGLANTVIGFPLTAPTKDMIFVQSEPAGDGGEVVDEVDPELVEMFLSDPDGFIAELDDLELLAKVVRAAINADPESIQMIAELADRNADANVLAALSDGVSQAVSDYALKGEADTVSRILAVVSETVSNEFSEQVTEKVEQAATEVAAQQASEVEPEVAATEPVPEAEPVPEESETPQADVTEGELAGDQTETLGTDTQSEVLAQPTDVAPAISADGGATGGTSEVSSTSSGTSAETAPASSSGTSSLPAIGSSGASGADSTPTQEPSAASPA